jgi:Dehydrogenases with different specificities (related to short-chain alcohol dehydrogenases)
VTAQRVALVTGGSRGIGAACARALAQAGYAVAVSYRSAPQAADEVVTQIRRAGGVAEAFQGDIADRSVAAALPGRVAERLGPPAVLVNNAGVQRSGSMRRLSDEDWDLMWSTNVDGARAITRAALPAMYATGWGRVIFVSSVLGATGGPGDSGYSATKAALLAMSRSLAMEVAPRGITSNAVLPGTISTDLSASVDPQILAANISLTAARRAGEADEVGAAVSFLASEQSSYVNGAEIAVHGGGWLTLPPP